MRALIHSVGLLFDSEIRSFVIQMDKKRTHGKVAQLSRLPLYNIAYQLTIVMITISSQSSDTDCGLHNLSKIVMGVAYYFYLDSWN